MEDSTVVRIKAVKGLKKEDGRGWTGLIWLSIGIGSEQLSMWLRTFGFQKRQRIS